MVFFKPTNDFLAWLKSYVGNRIVLDIGYGEGYFLTKMNRAGIKALGIDAFSPIIKDPTIEPFEAPSNVLFVGIENFLFNNGAKFLCILARPCHGDFPYITAMHVPNNIELLYIGLNENVSSDLNGFELKPIYNYAGEDDEVVLIVTGGNRGSLAKEPVW